MCEYTLTNQYWDMPRSIFISPINIVNNTITKSRNSAINLIWFDKIIIKAVAGRRVRFLGIGRRVEISEKIAQ